MATAVQTNLLWATLTIPPAAALNGCSSGAAERQLSVAGNRAVVPLTYGEDRIGGLVLNVLPAGTNSPTLLVQVLWGFALDSINDLRLNDRTLPAGSTQTHYTGSQSTTDAALVAGFAAQGITYTQTLAGYAYSVLAIPTRLFDAQLALTARLRGRRLYDVRKDSSAGGAGTHRLATPSTWEWSDCPTLAHADYLSNAVYGAGQAVDWSTVGAAANANDALVGAEKRRLIGLSFMGATRVADVSEVLRAHGGNFTTPGANGVRLLPDADAAAAASYSHAAGDIAALQPLTLRDNAGAPTAVEVVYTDTTKVPWRDNSVTATLPGAGTTKPWRLSQVRMAGVQRHSQGNREAIERLNKLTLQDLSTAVEVFDIGIRHEAGDIITLTHPVGLTAKPFRVVGVDMPAAGRWALTLVEHDPACYSTVVVTVPTVPDTLLLNPVGPPGNVAGLTGTVGQGIITWAWTAATESDADTRLRLGGTDWASAAPLWSGGATTLLQRVGATGTYTLRARHAVPDGAGGWIESTGTTSVAVTVAAGDLVQSEPGSPGLSQATVELYQWGSSAQPGNPSGTSTWTWATGANSTYSGGNGWLVAVGSNPGTVGARLWVARKAVSAPVGTATTSVDWTGGFSVFAFGVNGDTGLTGPAGIKAATPTVWRWDASIATITGSGTYTWAAADPGLMPSGWTFAPGTGSPGQTLYGASVQLVDAAGAATTAINWATASITSRGYAGTNGSAGGTGGTGQTGIGARRAYVLTTATSLGSGTVNSTGTASLPANGSFGASGWAATPSTPAVGQTLYQSDGLYNPATDLASWATPYISALKVGNLAALAVNTGALTVDGALTVSAGGGAYSSNYSAGMSGWALTTAGAQLPATSILGTLVIGQVPLEARNSELVASISAAATTANWGQVSGTGRPADGATRDVALVGRGTTIAGNAATKTTLAEGYNADVYSRDGYVGGVFASARAGQVNLRVLFGLNSNPIDSSDFPNLDYAIYFQDIGTIRIYESGTLVPVVESPYTTDNVFTVVYDGSAVRYTKNAVVLRSVSVASPITDPLFFHATFNTVGARLADIRVGPMSSNNWAAVGGTGKPEDYATVGATSAQALAISNNAAALTGKLNKAGADAIAGPISLNTANAILVGTLDDGVYMGNTGLVGRTGGSTTFSINTAGNVYLKGAVEALSGAIGGVVIGADHMRSVNFNGSTNGAGQLTSNGTIGWALVNGGQLMVDAAVQRGHKSSAGASNFVIHGGSLVSEVTYTTNLFSYVSNGFVTTVGVDGTVTLYLSSEGGLAEVWTTIKATRVSDSPLRYGSTCRRRLVLTNGLYHAASPSYTQLAPVNATWCFSGDYYTSRMRPPGISGIPLTPSMTSGGLDAGTWNIQLEVTVRAFAAADGSPISTLKDIRMECASWVHLISKKPQPPKPREAGRAGCGRQRERVARGLLAGRTCD